MRRGSRRWFTYEGDYPHETGGKPTICCQIRHKRIEAPGRAVCFSLVSVSEEGADGVMREPWNDVGEELDGADHAEWLVSDVPLARALFAGVPVARLLARTRLASDEEDIAGAPLAAGRSKWDALMTVLLGRSPSTFERLKRQVARHARAASDEGPLPAAPGVVATLAYCCAVSADADASLAEAFIGTEGAALDPSVARAAAAYDARLFSPLRDPRGALFEACVRLASRGSAGPWLVDRLAGASRQLWRSEAKLALVRRSNELLYPRDLESEVPLERRMIRLDRAELDVFLARDPRELAAIVARMPQEPTLDAHLDSLLADLARLLAQPGTLILAAALPNQATEGEEPWTPPSSRPPSWLPTDWSSVDAGAALADAFERGATTQPRLRAAVARGGEPALDAVGAEMLRVAAHPFASAAFAEILARSGRTRDVVRLVTYFAVAPDPAPAARALSACASPDLPSVLMAWLEAMLPSDGELAPPGADPVTSSAARLTACIASLAPYPHLYRAVRPLLSRVSVSPPPV